MTEPEAYPLGYVEDSVEPRIKLEECFSILAGCGKTNSAQQDFDGWHVWDNRGMLPQDAQKGCPARPQASRNRRRTLWGTLRISMNRERRWRTFSASCYESWYFAMRYRSVLRVILRSRLASEILPPVRCSASLNSFFSIS